MVKIKTLFLILVAGISASGQITKADTPRTKTSINSGWRFWKGDIADASNPNFDDRRWQFVSLPHTWNTSDPFDDEAGYYRGAGWYRRTLSLTASLKEKRLFLFFEGANQIAEVYVNGKSAGRHIGGYTAFAFEITQLVNRSGKNVIAVRVDNSFDKNIPPLTADFNFYGGIYRDAWLIATNDVHFAITDHASPGIRISTSNISKEDTSVAIDGAIENSGAKNKTVEIECTVFDSKRQPVSTNNSRIEVAANKVNNFHLLSPAVKNARLWTPDDPYLYTVKSAIRVDGKIVDEISQPLGFRWFLFDGEKGFSLNGKPLILRGVNRHQDYKGLGNAVPDRLHIRDMELIKSAGFNFVRLAHYPQDPSVLEAADRLGLLIWEEIPIVNYITNSAEFRENSLSMLLDMIRQHRNHPSVILWGYMNEVFLRVPKGADELYPATVALARELDKTAHVEDPTRPTTIAMHQNEVYNKYGLADVPSVVGWNIYQGWYSGKFNGFGEFIDDQHKRYPKRPMIISEYGANGDLRLHSLEPRRFDSTAEYQRLFHESYLDQIDERPFINGSALWSTFDFGSEFRGETIPHVNQKGMFTFDRRPKDILYFYKTRLLRGPQIHIATRDWPVRAGPVDTKYDIEVYCNRPTAELVINNKSMGTKSVEKGIARWSVTLQSGKNFLIARAPVDVGVVFDSTVVDFQAVSVASPEIRINVGSNADFVDASGKTWLADRAYTPGAWGFIGPDAKFIYSEPGDKNILGTGDDPLYQTMQEGLAGYKIDVPGGRYEVEMLFAEKKFTTAGQQVFSVAINGNPVISNLDLGAKPGPSRAYSAKFTVFTTSGLMIDFTRVKGEPILSGLRVRRL